jgi:hypothetical protein
MRGMLSLIFIHGLRGRVGAWGKNIDCWLSMNFSYIRQGKILVYHFSPREHFEVILSLFITRWIKWGQFVVRIVVTKTLPKGLTFSETNYLFWWYFQCKALTPESAPFFYYKWSLKPHQPLVSLTYWKSHIDFGQDWLYNRIVWVLTGRCLHRGRVRYNTSEQ